MPISFPFRVDPVTREVATVTSGSDQEITEAIALHVMTKPGERPMRPGFGTESLPFGDGLDAGSLQLQLTDYGWAHVNITSIETRTLDDGKVESNVNWERTS